MIESEAIQSQEFGLPILEELKGKKILYGRSFEHGYDVVLSLNDVFDFLVTVPNEHATLIVTSPPYNIGKPYEDTTDLKPI